MDAPSMGTSYPNRTEMRSPQSSTWMAAPPTASYATRYPTWFLGAVFAPTSSSSSPRRTYRAWTNSSSTTSVLGRPKACD
uniref:Uncharacterized protein n=1 Tax=Steinernema glaseri TaxID=37863 RepID=A0A1I7YEV6_9BILA